MKILCFFLILLLFLGCSRDWSNPLSPDEENDIKLIPTEGLVAYYPFNGNANDESGNGNNGIIHGNSVQFVDGVFGQAIQFDNSRSGTNTVNDYVELPNISISELTVSHWVKYNGGSSTSYSGAIYSIGIFPSRQFRVVIGNNGAVQVSIVINNSNFAVAGVDISDHQWHYITITADKEYVKFYHEAKLIGTTSLGFELGFGDASQQFALHRFSGSMSSRFTGELDNCRIYNRVLTETEIQALYHEEGWGY